MLDSTVINNSGSILLIRSNGNIFSVLVSPRLKHLIVGDLVDIKITSFNEAEITKFFPRNNCFKRSDSNHTKFIAANIDQVIIVVSSIPKMNLLFLDLCLLEAQKERITPIILINKIDLAESKEFIALLYDIYDNLGFQIFEYSANQKTNHDSFLKILSNKTSLLIGNSGVGKTSIINSIFASNYKVNATTNNKGKHTTSTSTMYQKDNIKVIDAPGVNWFGIAHLSIDEIIALMPEFADITSCKFRDCKHQITSPLCKVIEQLNKIHQSRASAVKYLTS